MKISLLSPPPHISTTNFYEYNIDIQNSNNIFQPSCQIPQKSLPTIPIENRDKNGNVLCVVDNGGSLSFPSITTLSGIKIEWGGKNNTIILYGQHQFLNCLLQTGGDSTFVIRESQFPIWGLRFFAKWAPHNTFYIGKNFRCYGVDFRAAEAGIHHYIGDNCLFSYDVTLRSTDAHSIFDGNKKLINRASDFYIGNNVWICHHVEVLKNACILDGTIIGACSLVVKKQNEKNILIAGNPTKLIRKDIYWDFKNPSYFDAL